MSHDILTVYPRKHATRIALFQDSNEIMRQEIRHDRVELEKFARISDQWSHRLRALEEFLGDHGLSADDRAVDAVIGPAAIPSYLPGGVYVVDRDLLEKLRKNESDEHYIDLGATLADSLARIRKSRAFALTALSSEEFDPISRISGIPELKFGRTLHTLNIKDAIHKASEEIAVPFGEISAIVAHLGMSFSICAHAGGRVLDLSNANEQGPFSPARSGGVPAAAIVRKAYSGEWTREDLLDRVCASGGMKSYTGTDRLLTVATRIARGDAEAALVFRSMAYRIAQEIAAQASVLRGKVDAIVLTGGCTKDEVFVELIKEHVAWIADHILVYRGEDELKSMADSAVRVLNGRETLRTVAQADA